MSARKKISLPIEALSEYKVLEILSDGKEILERPLTATDRFERIVDTKDEGENKATKVSEKSWNNIREWIRSSYYEVCAFLDFISVYKETKCMAIFQVAPNDQDSEFGGRSLSAQALICLGGKKMILSNAATILLRGAQRFHARNIEKMQEQERFVDGQRPLSYHESLLELRKAWRIKLSQNSILGDVSLRCIGSRGKEGGIFEIIEADRTQPSYEGIHEPIKVKFSSTMESLLNKEQVTGRLRVTIRHLGRNKKDWFQSLVLQNNGPLLYRQFKRPKTQFDRLCLAQNLLMCREIMSSLFYESSLIGIDKFNNDIIAFSSPNKVIATIYPGVQLAISLEKAVDLPLESGEVEYPALSTQLKKLILRQHVQSWFNIASIPYPVTGPVQVPLHLRGGGASIFLNSSKFPQGQNDGGVPIITNCVNGMGNSAASAWITYQNQALRAAPHQPYSAPRGQERYAYFNDWALNQQSLQQQVQSTADEVSVSGLMLSSLEHDLRSNHASPEAIACILGSGDGLLTPIVKIARHRVLRQRVATTLTKFVREIAEERMSITTVWYTISTMLSTSVRVTMYSLGHATCSTRFLISVGVEEISVKGICGTSPAINIPANADLQQELLRILKLQELRTKMYTIQSLAAKFLGWVQLGCPGMPFVDSPLSALLLASRRGNRVVCIRASDKEEGLEFWVAKSQQRELTMAGSRGDLLQNLLSCGDGISSRFHFRKVDLTRVSGQNVVGKVENLLTCLNFA
nr:transcriptional co activator crsp77 [Hymenolepis microstoma]